MPLDLAIDGKASKGVVALLKAAAGEAAQTKEATSLSA